MNKKDLNKTMTQQIPSLLTKDKSHIRELATAMGYSDVYADALELIAEGMDRDPSYTPNLDFLGCARL